MTGRTVLERAFAATYRSLGVRYPTWLPLALLPLAILVASGGVFAMRAYVDMTLEQLAVLAGLAVALFAIEAAAVIVLVHRQVEPVQRWLRGGRDAADAEEAFSAALALPLRRGAPSAPARPGRYPCSWPSAWRRSWCWIGHRRRWRSCCPVRCSSPCTGWC